MGKSVLVVFAHPDLNSFNAALLKTSKEVLGREGHTVEVSDLYRMNFDPVMTKEQHNGKSIIYKAYRPI